MTGADARWEAILVLLGQRFLRENSQLGVIVTRLHREQPSWSAAEVVNTANRQITSEKMRDSLQVQPGVVVANQAVMGRATPQMDGTAGTMARRTNAVAAQGGDRPSFQQLNSFSE